MFGEFDIRYFETPAVDLYKAFCKHHSSETDQCVKSMRINQASTPEAVVRRLKAWCLQTLMPTVEDKHSHVFLTMVPVESSTGTDAELDSNCRIPLSRLARYGHHDPPPPNHGPRQIPY